MGEGGWKVRITIQGGGDDIEVWVWAIGLVWCGILGIG